MPRQISSYEWFFLFIPIALSAFLPPMTLYFFSSVNYPNFLAAAIDFFSNQTLFFYQALPFCFLSFLIGLVIYKKQRTFQALFFLTFSGLIGICSTLVFFILNGITDPTFSLTLLSTTVMAFAFFSARLIIRYLWIN